MKLNIFTEAFKRCIDEMYRYAQPPTTLEEINKEDKFYMKHYLSDEETKIILDKYVYSYNFENKFKDHCDLIIQDMKDGCKEDNWIEPKDGSPGYRGYKDVPSLDTIIGEENLKKVIEFIESRKEYYRFNKALESFRFNVLNVAPCCNKQKVIDYWKSQNKDIEIEDRNEDDMWYVHQYGLTWDEWREENETE